MNLTAFEDDCNRVLNVLRMQPVANSLTVLTNLSGIPEERVERSLDYLVAHQLVQVTSTGYVDMNVEIRESSLMRWKRCLFLHNEDDTIAALDKCIAPLPMCHQRTLLIELRLEVQRACNLPPQKGALS